MPCLRKLGWECSKGGSKGKGGGRGKNGGKGNSTSGGGSATGCEERGAPHFREHCQKYDQNNNCSKGKNYRKGLEYFGLKGTDGGRCYPGGNGTGSDSNGVQESDGRSSLRCKEGWGGEATRRIVSFLSRRVVELAGCRPLRCELTCSRSWSCSRNNFKIIISSHIVTEPRRTQISWGASNKHDVGKRRGKQRFPSTL